MRVALGLKAHSGWAALVALGGDARAPCVLERTRVELAREVDAEWAKQPYHAAEGLEPEDARDVVKRGIESARRLAARELHSAVKRCAAAGNEVCGCGVLVGAGMPAWSVEEILAVHFRMHKAEGELFRDALVRAVQECALPLCAIPEKRLGEEASAALGLPRARLDGLVGALGKSAGAPWGKDQKDAALAALIALAASAKQPARAERRA
jgi:hypothetical protein